jgi:hypothetical protein
MSVAGGCALASGRYEETGLAVLPSCRDAAAAGTESAAPHTASHRDAPRRRGTLSAMRRLAGMPGAGKTTLAYPLAAELGYSLVAKDMLKEKLHDVLCPAGQEPDPVWSRQLGAASMELLWTLAASAGDTTRPADVPAVASEIRRLHARAFLTSCR